VPVGPAVALDIARIHDRHASSAWRNRFSCSMTGAGQPRRVVASGPNRSDEPSSAIDPDTRLQPVLPETCWAESKVMVGAGAGAGVGVEVGVDAPSAAAEALPSRHVVPTSEGDALEAAREADAVGAAAEVAGATPGVAGVALDAAAPPSAGVFAHATPSARITTSHAVPCMPPF
jgi:hypothetical protein